MSGATSPPSTMQGRRIKLADGRELGYDYLIIATGVSANYFGVKGALENTFGLYTRVDAIVLRDHIMNGFDWLDEDPDGPQRAHDHRGRRRRHRRGAGGRPGRAASKTCCAPRSPPSIPSRVHVRLIEMSPALLMPFHPKLREYARKQLVKRGVDIRLNTQIREVAPDRVMIGDGQSLPSDLTVWTGGVAAPEAAASWGLPQGQHGRILVGPDLRVKGSDRIFAVGDIALEPDDPSPQLAQPALQEGRHVARQITRLLRGEQTEPFKYHDKGTMATIGRQFRRRAAGQGPADHRVLAWLAWLGLHLFYLLGYRNRIATLINLSWRYIAWGHGGGVIVGDEPMEPLPSGTTSE